MKLRLALGLCAGAVALAVPAIVSAHFILMEPKGWIEENQLGDPQKAGPCGGTSQNAGTPTHVITTVPGGELLHVKVKETVYHPGHFRVALAVLDRKELPTDPEDVTREGTRGPISVSGKVSPDKPPILADGILDHHTRIPQQEFDTYVKIPNINCDHCTLQVIQFMEEHGVNPDGRFTYHHCADLKIVANRRIAIDTSWPGQSKNKARPKQSAAVKGKPKV
jgi:hypothetical protein